MTDNPTTPAPAGGESRSGDRPPAGRPSREGGRRDDRGRGPRRGGPGGPGGRRFFRRRRVCKFCVEKIDHIDYKEVAIRQFVGDRGKILPRRVSGVCAPHQRQLKVAIKRARNIALLPFAAGHGA